MIDRICCLRRSFCVRFRSRNLPPCVFVLSLLYMKRLRALPSALSLTKIDQLTTKELYLIAALLADKYLVDEGENDQLFNSDLAELTGMKCERINLIERQVLIALNWNLHVSNDEFEQFYTHFRRHIIRKDSPITIDDSKQFYDLCFQYLGKLLEYLTLTSLVLLGSTISILTAVHLATVTHSTLMKAFNPSTNCSECSKCKRKFTSSINFLLWRFSTNEHHLGNAAFAFTLVFIKGLGQWNSRSLSMEIFLFILVWFHSFVDRSSTDDCNDWLTHRRFHFSFHPTSPCCVVFLSIFFSLIKRKNANQRFSSAKILFFHCEAEKMFVDGIIMTTVEVSL